MSRSNGCQMPKTDPVVIVIVTYNSVDVIDDLLDSIPSAIGSLDSHVVVVDNSSTDGTYDLLGARHNLSRILSPNDGYAAGINTGVASAPGRGPIIVLNPDVRLHPGCLERLVAVLDTPDVGIAVPMLRAEDGSLAPSIRRTPTILRSLGLGFTGLPPLSEPDNRERSHQQDHTVDWATGAVLAVARLCHERLGGWDESFFLYSEETDFCLRAKDVGYRTVYNPSAVATHVGGGSGTSEKTYTMQVVNRVRLYARRQSRIAAWIFFATAIGREGAHAARGDRNAKAALAALIRPPERPVELRCRGGLLPE